MNSRMRETEVLEKVYILWTQDFADLYHAHSKSCGSHLKTKQSSKSFKKTCFLYPSTILVTCSAIHAKCLPLI